MTPAFQLPKDFAQIFWRRRPSLQYWKSPAPFDAETIGAACRRAPESALSFDAAPPPGDAQKTPPLSAPGHVSILSNLDRHVPDSRAWLSCLYQGIEDAVGHFPDFEPTAFLQTRDGGMEAHFDTGDVFSVQLEGRKTWHLYPADLVPPEMRAERERLPQAGGGRRVHHFYDSLDLRDPVSFDLAPGDVLYVPECWIHRTFSPDGSLSVSVSPRSFSFSRWIREATQSALDAQPVDSYAVVPPPAPAADGVLPVPGESLARAVALSLKALDASALEDAWHRWQSRGWFDASPTGTRELETAAPLTIAPGVRLITAPSPDGGTVRVYAAGNCQRLPSELMPCVEAVARVETATVEHRIKLAAEVGAPPAIAERVLELLFRSGFFVTE